MEKEGLALFFLSGGSSAVSDFVKIYAILFL